VGWASLAIDGHPELHPEVVGTSRATHQQQLRVPLPPNGAHDVTLTFKGAHVEIQGKWVLTLEPATE
jgi:hypothetical protein